MNTAIMWQSKDLGELYPYLTSVERPIDVGRIFVKLSNDRVNSLVFRFTDSSGKSYIFKGADYRNIDYDPIEHAVYLITELHQLGARVPKIHFHDKEQKFMVMEDCGDDLDSIFLHGDSAVRESCSRDVVYGLLDFESKCLAIPNLTKYSRQEPTRGYVGGKQLEFIVKSAKRQFNTGETEELTEYLSQIRRTLEQEKKTVGHPDPHSCNVVGREGANYFVDFSFLSTDSPYFKFIRFLECHGNGVPVFGSEENRDKVESFYNFSEELINNFSEELIARKIIQTIDAGELLFEYNLVNELLQMAYFYSRRDKPIKRDSIIGNLASREYKSETSKRIRDFFIKHFR